MANGRKAVVAKISSEKELDACLQELCRLMSSRELLPQDQERMRDLARIIGEYEDEHHPIPDPSHASLLKHLLDAKKGGVSKLARETRIPIEDIKAILSGNRQMQPQEANAFAKYFAVEASLFDLSPAPKILGGVGVDSSSLG